MGKRTRELLRKGKIVYGVIALSVCFLGSNHLKTKPTENTKELSQNLNPVKIENVG